MLYMKNETGCKKMQPSDIPTMHGDASIRGLPRAPARIARSVLDYVDDGRPIVYVDEVMPIRCPRCPPLNLAAPGTGPWGLLRDMAGEPLRVARPGPKICARLRSRDVAVHVDIVRRRRRVRQLLPVLQ